MKRNGTVLCLLLMLGLPMMGFAAEWHTFENCKLKENPYNDGDSFHVLLPKGKDGKHDERIFRLCFVDTPEVDNTIPDRVQDQADYWGISTNRTIRLGEEAKQFTQDFLKDRFTVYTYFKDAKGRSRLPRYFAMIQVDGRWLSTALVLGILPIKFAFSAICPKKSVWKWGGRGWISSKEISLGKKPF